MLSLCWTFQRPQNMDTEAVFDKDCPMMAKLLSWLSLAFTQLHHFHLEIIPEVVTHVFLGKQGLMKYSPGWGCKQTSYWMKLESLYYGATVQPLNSASISVNLDSRELFQWAWRTTRPWQYLTRFQKDGARSQQCIYGATCWDPPGNRLATGTTFAIHWRIQLESWRRILHPDDRASVCEGGSCVVTDRHG